MKLDQRTFASTPWSCGWRSPNGMGVDAKGRLFVTDNQGDWVGTSALFWSEQGQFHGHPASLVWRDGWSADPLAMSTQRVGEVAHSAGRFFPHGLMANSPTQPVCDRTGGKFGPFAGQMIVGEMNTPRLLRVMIDEVRGRLQGACVPFIDGGGLRAGNHRLAFAPDGSLWVGQTHLAWAGGEGLQRLKWTGRLPMDVLRVELQPGGFLFTFTQPVAPQTAAMPWTSPPLPLCLSRDLRLAPIRADHPPLAEDRGPRPWTATLGARRNCDSGGEVYEFSLPALAAANGTPLINRLVCYTVNAVP